MSKSGKRHLTQEQRMDLIRRAHAGERAPELADAFNVKVRQVFKILETVGPPDAAHRRGAKGVSAAAREAALRRIAAGETVVAVARDLDVDRGTIFRWRRQGKPAGD